MNRRRWAVAVAAALALVLTVVVFVLRGSDRQSVAPTSKPGAATAMPSSSSRAPIPTQSQVYLVTHFVGVVNLHGFSEECKRVACWLPTQFQPGLVKDETVGKQDVWPKQGAKVLVFCQTKGDPYINGAGQTVDDWYGIVVPKNEIDPSAAKRATEMTSVTGYRAFVGISWISGGEGLLAPEC